MPKAFLVKKKRQFARSPGAEQRNIPDSYANGTEFSGSDAAFNMDPSAVMDVTHSLLGSAKSSVLSSLSPLLTSPANSVSSCSAFKPFKQEKENAPKKFKASLTAVEGSREKHRNKEVVNGREVLNEKQPELSAGTGGKTAVLEHKEFAIFSDKYEFPKAKGPLPQSQFICQLCDEVYTDPFSLAQHKCSGIQHTEYRCPECDKVFSCPANLASHRRWHRPRSPKEEKKPRTPAQTSSAAKTQITTTVVVPEKQRETASPVLASERPAITTTSQGQQFVCDVCNKTFRRKAYLRKHMNNHNDDRPYPCQYCGKVFRSLTNRAKHVLNHAVGPKSFTCNVCGNGFANKGSLDRHSRIHTGEIYSCKHCSSTFYSSPGLTRHINKCHPPENHQVIVLQVPVRQG